jgi:hypothetical protein
MKFFKEIQFQHHAGMILFQEIQYQYHAGMIFL